MEKRWNVWEEVEGKRRNGAWKKKGPGLNADLMWHGYAIWCGHLVPHLCPTFLIPLIYVCPSAKLLSNYIIC